ncbi:MAG: hypothetical protein E6L04_02225 [Thaumarchaeota archaeon]|nr:MAG: hypothetical protein E6L04_02225 [Nitrososphaerota archaeon]TLX88856.1 MAG: hypothetical protein E6K97_06315 [Nitrososphaerota archaeon]
MLWVIWNREDIPYSHSKNESIRLKRAGFECAITKNAVNDLSTFLKNKNMIIRAENFTFCIEARKLG